MARRLNFGKKFEGGSTHKINDNIRYVKNNYFAPGHAGWWNPERDKKLLYILNNFPADGYRKAESVLGCPRWNISQHVRFLWNKFFKEEEAYEEYINNGGEPFINEELI